MLIAHKCEADNGYKKRKEELLNAGAEIACIDDSAEAGDWSSIVQVLGTADEDACLMVEGGATVITSLLKAHAAGIVSIDHLVITIGKTMLGKDGIGYEGIPLDSFKHLKTEEFGQDTVIAFVRKH
jgi:riboflavin biosynthesis pyrimidine reductase